LQQEQGMAREKLATEVEAELLAQARAIAREEGRDLDAVIDQALADYVARRKRGEARAHVMDAYEGSHARYAGVYERLEASSPAAEQSRRKGRETTDKVCPECGHIFQGEGWGGIDAHWRAKHEDIMPYEKAWPLLKSGKYNC
jgi:hypothetical protein